VRTSKRNHHKTLKRLQQAGPGGERNRRKREGSCPSSPKKPQRQREPLPGKQPVNNTRQTNNTLWGGGKKRITRAALDRCTGNCTGWKKGHSKTYMWTGKKNRPSLALLEKTETHGTSLAAGQEQKVTTTPKKRGLIRRRSRGGVKKGEFAPSEKKRGGGHTGPAARELTWGPPPRSVKTGTNNLNTGKKKTLHSKILITPHRLEKRGTLRLLRGGGEITHKILPRRKDGSRRGGTQDGFGRLERGEVGIWQKKGHSPSEKGKRFTGPKRRSRPGSMGKRKRAFQGGGGKETFTKNEKH